MLKKIPTFIQNSFLFIFLFFIPYSVFAVTKITNCSELQAMNLNLADSYQLMNDIDCSQVNFVPVGSFNTPFTGSFYGTGYKISNLTISASGLVGLFGATNGATIGQVTLDNLTIIKNINGNYGGGLVGRAMWATQIYDVTASGIINFASYGGGLVGELSNKGSLVRGISSIDITVSGGYAGGLVGTVYDTSLAVDVSSIKNSYATGSVKGMFNGTGGAGGLIGVLNSGAVAYSYATGDVGISTPCRTNCTPLGSFGGLIGMIGSGHIELPPPSVTHSYATGNVTGNSVINTTQGETIGGLIGWVHLQANPPHNPSITDSFATGNVFGVKHVGGLIGMNDFPSLQLSNSYSVGTVTTTANEAVGGLIGYNKTNESLISSSYWDIQQSGRATSAGGVGKMTAEMYQQETYVDWDFNNTWKKEAEDYPKLKLATEIKNCNDLQAINDYLSGSYVLLNNVNCSGVKFNPIGNSITPFTGSFDGNGKTISNLNIYSTVSHVGLFGVTKNANISNVVLQNATVFGHAPVGTVVGQAKSSLLSHISVSGKVSAYGHDYYCGGLVGELRDASSVRYSMSSVTVEAKNQTARVGGLIGGIYNSHVLNSYAIGAVNGDANVGGLVGALDQGLISNTYSIGKVTGSKGLTGGLVGGSAVSTGSKVINSYFNTETSGQQYSGGGTGKTTNELFQQSTYLNWDFNNIWDIQDGANYPWLRKG